MVLMVLHAQLPSGVLSTAASSSAALQWVLLPRLAGEVSTGDVCTECPLGSFTFNASSECTQCPTGANCFGARVSARCNVLAHGVMTAVPSIQSLAWTSAAPVVRCRPGLA